MSALADATVAIVGVGGMGIRHVRACRKIGARVIALCDVRQQALDAAQPEAPEAESYTSVERFVESVAGRADLVSIVTNAPFRARILLDVAAAGARRVLTEKPFTTNVGDAHGVAGAYERAGIPLTVNTFRRFCPNHLRLRDLIRSGEIGRPRYVAIHSASTGLGNMGSVFFDVMNFYVDSAPVEIVGDIDTTGTPSVRGPEYQDPGGYGMVRYENGARGFLDTSEDTGVPYTFHIVTTHGRVFIDELFNRWHIAARTAADQTARPLTAYLTPLHDRSFEQTQGYDPVEMTSFSMAAALEDRPEARNARDAVTVMEMIMAMHVSGRQGRRPVPLPLDPCHHALDVPFA